MTRPIINTPILCSNCLQDGYGLARTLNDRLVGFTHNNEFKHLNCYANETAAKINFEAMQVIASPQAIREAILPLLTGHIRVPRDENTTALHRVKLAKIEKRRSIDQISSEINRLKDIKPKSLDIKRRIRQLTQDHAFNTLCLKSLQQINHKTLRNRPQLKRLIKANQNSENSDLRFKLHYLNQQHQSYLAPKITNPELDEPSALAAT